MKIKIAPSILSADFGKLNEEIASVDRYCDMIHVDVMDGHFVPNITMGPPVVAKIRSRKPFDCHLMIENPEQYIGAFVKAGAWSITVHQEVCTNLRRVVQQIKSHKVRASVSINPATPLEEIRHVLDDVDMVLLMTVNPGFGGQKFIRSVISKIRELRRLKPKLDIQVDGGINDKTAKIARQAGANVLVAGSYIFDAKDRKQAIESLRAYLGKF